MNGVPSDEMLTGDAGPTGDVPVGEAMPGTVGELEVPGTDSGLEPVLLVGLAGVGTAGLAEPTLLDGLAGVGVGITGGVPGALETDGFDGVNVNGYGVPAGLPAGVVAGVLAGEALGEVEGCETVGEGFVIGVEVTVGDGVGRGVDTGPPAVSRLQVERARAG